MSKIITITFSPSIDKSASVTTMKPDVKLKCTEPNTDPGGGGINVARVLKRLGADVTAIFPSGGFNGVFFNHLISEEHVKFISIATKNETKENFVIFEQETNKQFRFGMPNIELFENEWKNCLNALENIDEVDFIIASGSLPVGIPFEIFQDLAKIAKTKKAKFIVDTSGEALKNAIDEGVFLIKPNIEELGLLLGIADLQKDDIEHAAKKLIIQNNIEIIVVSLGSNGALLVTKDETHEINPPKVAVKNTVGAGDSMVAGLVFALSNNFDLKTALQYGIACGTATTMKIGSELCDKTTVLDLLAIIKKQ